MKIEAENPTLVIAGSWNPAILTPQWIAQAALGKAADEQFVVKVTIDPLQGQGAVRRLSFLDIELVAAPQVLIFFIDPKNPESSAKAIAAARTILQTLTHTPISGVGCNFLFSVEENKIEFLDLFRSTNYFEGVLENSEIVSKSWGNKIQADDELIGVECVHEGNVGSIRLNFHHSVQTASEAVEYLTDEKYPEILGQAIKIAENLSNERIEGAIT